MNEIIIHNTQWEIPEDLLKQVQVERMINAVCDMVKPLEIKDQVGDAEVAVYLYPLVNRQPVPGRISKIYLYCVRNVFKRMKRDFTEMLEVKAELTNNEQRELDDLKEMIYKERKKIKHPFLEAIKEINK